MASSSPQAPMETTLALIKPDAVGAGNAQAIVQLTLKAGFTVASKRICQLSPERAGEFYAEHELTKPGAVKAWRDLIGPTNSGVARETKPESIRALYGTDGTKNAAHGSANLEDAARELVFFFPEVRNTKADSEAAQFKAVLQDKLQPALAYGLASLAQLHKRKGSLPEDSVAWLGQWLLDNNPNKAGRRQLDTDLKDGDSSGADGASGGAPKSALAAWAASAGPESPDLTHLAFPFPEPDSETFDGEADGQGSGEDGGFNADAEADGRAGLDEEDPQAEEDTLEVEPSAANFGAHAADEASEYGTEYTDASLSEEETGDVGEEAADEDGSRPAPAPGARRSVLIVEGRNMTLMTNPGDLSDEGEQSPLEERAPSVGSPVMRRQSTLFERRVIPVDDDDEEEEEEENPEDAADEDSPPVATEGTADEYVDEAADEAAEPAAPVGEESAALGEASEYETDYTEGASEYTDEEEEEELREPAAEEPAAE